MPDHLHFLARLNTAAGLVNAGKRGLQPEGILDHVARFKSFTTQVSWKCGVSGTLWQRSSYDTVLDLGKPIDEVANYIVDKPVRKGLIAEGVAWKYAGRTDPI